MRFVITGLEMIKFFDLSRLYALILIKIKYIRFLIILQRNLQVAVLGEKLQVIGCSWSKYNIRIMNNFDFL